MLRALLLPVVLLGAACSQPAQQQAAAPPTTQATMSSDMSAMPMRGTTAQADVIGSTGTVTQVDANAGTVTLNHQAITAINWPAMTMQFHAEDPAILHGIAVGDHVAFELKSASEPQVVAAIHRQ